MRTVFMLALAAVAAGCQPYLQAQMGLAEQARRGVAAAREAHGDRGRLLQQFHEMQRRQLDAAFDADVNEQPELSAAWVIEHRRVYAAALDALARQLAANQQAEAAAAGNLAATEAALQKLLRLQSLQVEALSVRR